MSQDDQSEKPESPSNLERRSFLSAAMAGGLVVGYGTFAGYAGRFLYPPSSPKGWMFVTEVAAMNVGDSIGYRTPAGAAINVTRQDKTGTADAFVALSSTCPHLGCRVNWEAHHNRFFCPCHNGVFDPTGNAISGPPADAGQVLFRYPLKVEQGLLFIEVPVES